MSNEAPTDALRLPDRFVQLATDAAWARNVDKATAMMVDLDDLYALLLAAKAAPASPLPGGGWQDISTAPKDGTVIDAWRNEGGRETVFWGYPHHECGEMGGLCDSDWHSIRSEGWVCNYFNEFLGRSHNPFTHWMPLPAAPKGEPK